VADPDDIPKPAADVPILPDEDNREQQDDDQAQDVARDALEGLPGDDHDILGSSKPRGGIADDNDLSDTVDQLNQMLVSGRIDMGAYAGEPMMDDSESGRFDGAVSDSLQSGDDDVAGALEATAADDDADSEADADADAQRSPRPAERRLRADRSMTMLTGNKNLGQ